jgi:hypothetical protein
MYKCAQCGGQRVSRPSGRDYIKRVSITKELVVSTSHNSFDATRAQCCLSSVDPRTSYPSASSVPTNFLRTTGHCDTARLSILPLVAKLRPPPGELRLLKPTKLPLWLCDRPETWSQAGSQTGLTVEIRSFASACPLSPYLLLLTCRRSRLICYSK